MCLPGIGGLVGSRVAMAPVERFAVHEVVTYREAGFLFTGAAALCSFFSQPLLCLCSIMLSPSVPCCSSLNPSCCCKLAWVFPGVPYLYCALYCFLYGAFSLSTSLLQHWSWWKGIFPFCINLNFYLYYWCCYYYYCVFKKNICVLCFFVFWRKKSPARNKCLPRAGYKSSSPQASRQGFSA